MSNKEIIYKAYKEFYKKEPNFNKNNFRNLIIEIHSMVYILSIYKVKLGPYRFRYEYENIRMPISMELQDILLTSNIDDLADDSLELTERAFKIINIVGAAIRNATKNRQDRIEVLRKISDILYVKERVLPGFNDEKVTKITKYTVGDLRYVRNLIKLISEEMTNSEISIPDFIFMDEYGNRDRPKISEEASKKKQQKL